MQNFYIVLDATEKDSDGNELLRVGISSEVPISTHWIIYIMAIICLILWILGNGSCCK